MAKKPDIEKTFREAFEDYAPQPHPSVWKKISGNLPGNFTLPAIIGGFILVAALIASYLFLNPKDTRLTEEKPESIELLEKSPVINNKSTIDTKEINRVMPIVERNPVRTIPKSQTTTTGQPSAEPPAIPSSRPDTAGGTVEPVKLLGSLTKPMMILSDTAGCPPLHLVLKCESPGFRSIRWEINGNIIGTDRVLEHSFLQSGTYTLSMIVTDSSGTDHNAEQSIRVHPLPSGLFKMDINSNPDDTRTAYFYNYSENVQQFQWYFGDGDSSLLSDPVHTYEKPGKYEVVLISQSAEGCVDTSRQSIPEENAGKPIRFPNAFSPNPNGPSGGYYNPSNRNNDVFHPYISLEPVEYQLSIYNSAGILVFETRDPNMGWDGYFRQKLQPRGVYIWKVKARFSDGSRFEDMSDVTLL